MDKIWVPLISSFVGSFGFGLIFNVERKHLVYVAFGGFLTWGMFLLCSDLFSLGVLLSTIFAAVSCQVYAEILARLFKAPTTVFFIPGIVPLIPGGSLYNTMYAAVFQNWAQVREYGMQTLLGTLGIAIGLSAVSGILFVIMGLKKQRKK